MTIRIKEGLSDNSLLHTVEERAEVNLAKCYQCKKCSLGCPVSRKVQSPPSEIIRRLQLGAGNELLQTDLIWTCLSCETCSVRCPNEINFAGVIDALRTIALQKGVAKPKGAVPLFNRLFLDAVKRYGRSYDLQMIGLYKLRTGNISQDLNKFPTMLKKGKMAVLPPSSAGKNTVKRIFDAISKQKGSSK
jgi:heterodisulfide reductase subunit C2